MQNVMRCILTERWAKRQTVFCRSFSLSVSDQQLGFYQLTKCSRSRTESCVCSEKKHKQELLYLNTEREWVRVREYERLLCHRLPSPPVWALATSCLTQTHIHSWCMLKRGAQASGAVEQKAFLLQPDVTSIQHHRHSLICTGLHLHLLD